MTCCNNDCNQGRECPNRPVRNLPQWQDVVSIGLLIAVLTFGYFVYMDTPRQNGYKVYDCSLAEISPDFPIEAKEACRKLRANK
jgi:hypothetical protein